MIYDDPGAHVVVSAMQAPRDQALNAAVLWKNTSTEQRNHELMRVYV